MLIFAVAAAEPAPEPAPEVVAFGRAVHGMLDAIRGVTHATFVLHQQELVSGRLQDPVVMRVRYRAPNDAYVEWENGQRILWLPGQNDDRMWVDPGRFLPNLSLSPESSLAKRGQRHTIRRLGLAPVAELFAADLRRIEADPARLAPTEVTTSAPTLYGQAAQCTSATLRKDLEPALYATRVEVCLDARGLPLRMTMWDLEGGALRMIEQYGYEGLDPAPALPPDAFEPAALGF